MSDVNADAVNAVHQLGSDCILCFRCPSGTFNRNFYD